MKIYYYVCLAIMASACSGVERYNASILENHSIEELKEDTDKAYSQLQKHHPKLYQYVDKPVLDAKFDSLKGTFTKPLTSRAFYEAIAPVIRSVRQGHISVSPPTIRRSRTERKAYRDKKFAFRAMDFDYVENRLWLADAPEEDSLIIGSEVILVGDDKPQDIIKKYNGLIASDGFNTTLYQTFVGSRFARFYQRDKGFLDSISITYKNTDSVFTKMYRWEDKNPEQNDTIANGKEEEPKVEPIKLTKEEKKAKKLEIKEKRKANDRYGYIPSTKKYTRQLTFVGKDSTVGYMKIRGFTRGSYDDFYAESFKILDSLETKELVIDLRDNGGGRLSDIDDLYSYLTDEPYLFINPAETNSRVPFLNYFMSNTQSGFLRSLAVVFSPVIVVHNYLKTNKEDGKIFYHYKYEKEKEPKENNYKGKLYVLINGNSFSASSIISTHLQANERATFVGQETGGAYNGTVAGMYKGVELPNSKVKVSMGMMQIEAPQKQDPDGYGVKADVVLSPTRADRENGIDTELQWILDDIEANK